MAASLICFASGAARADEDPVPPEPEKEGLDRPGLDLGARVALGLPLGDVAQGDRYAVARHLSDFMSATFPIALEATIRGNKNTALGLEFELAPAITKNCDPGLSCSATDYRLTFEVLFTSRAGLSVDPWLGLGVGYEWLDLSESGMGSASFTGWTYARIEAGGEIRVGSQGAIGPFVGFSLGEYSSGSANGLSGDVMNPSLHEWLQVGLRGTINL